MKFRVFKALARSTILGVFSSSLFASEGLLLGFDLTVGGDTVAEFSDDTSQDLGDGIGFHIGYQFEFGEDNSFGLQATVGHSFDDPNVENGSTEITRTPMHLFLVKKFEQHQLGAGLVFHSNINLRQRISGLGSFDVDFDDARGYGIQYGYSVSENIQLGGRYVDIDYELGSVEFDASNIGFFAAWVI